MGHIDHHLGTDLVGNAPKGFKIEGTGIGAGTGDNQGRLAFKSNSFNFIVVDETGFLVHTVRNNVVQLSGKVYGGTMGKMTTVGQVHTQHGISRLTNSKIYRHIGLRTGMGLDIGVFSTE